MNRVWRLVNLMTNDKLKMTNEGALSAHYLKLQQKTHQTIKAVTEDIDRFSFNTAIARLMELTNAYYEYINNNSDIGHLSLDIGHLLLLISPFAPHLAEELWSQLGNKESICKQPWPTYNPELAKESELNIPVQVNGKLRDTVVVPAEAAEAEIKAAVLGSEKIKTFLAGKQIVKTIIVGKKLVNLVVK